MSLCENFEFPKLMRYFEDISAIPRASYKEEKIADYLCSFAAQRGYEYYRDEAHNVLINAPAADGCEDYAPILLQGHTDMVCEKNADTEHDFDTQGLKLYTEDGYIRARGTTLGADDGVAVAAMLCILDGGVRRHGALQCLFTSAEEVGLDGVRSFDCSKIFARKMINMDSAEDDRIIVGCAGGERSELTFFPTPETHTGEAVRIKIKGLAGGHSGEDAHRGRANANKLMGHVLYEVLDEGAQLAYVAGGSKVNAIPRECEAVILCKDAEAVCGRARALRDRLSAGLSHDDKNFEISAVTEGAATLECIDKRTAEGIVTVMHTVPNGVLDMNHDIEGLVEYSANIGVVLCYARSASITFSARSAYEQRIELFGTILDNLAKILGARVSHFNRYPGWSYAEKSALREEHIKAYRELFGEEPYVTVIHAGLECGYISEAIRDMDIICYGPNIRDLHSPDERLEIASFARFFKVVKKIIEG